MGEAAQERLRGELDRVQASGVHMAQQLQDLQARLQRAQAQGERFDQQQQEARQAAEVAQQEAERLQRELGVLRGDREQLEDQKLLLGSEVERAMHSERGA